MRHKHVYDWGRLRQWNTELHNTPYTFRSVPIIKPRVMPLDGFDFFQTIFFLCSYLAIFHAVKLKRFSKVNMALTYIHDDGSMIFSCPLVLLFRVLHENKFPGSFLQPRANMASFDVSRVWPHMLKRVIRPRNDFEETADNKGGNWPIIRVPVATAILSIVQDGWDFHPWLTPSM